MGKVRICKLDGTTADNNVFYCRYAFYKLFDAVIISLKDYPLSAPFAKMSVGCRFYNIFKIMEYVVYWLFSFIVINNSRDERSTTINMLYPFILGNESMKGFTDCIRTAGKAHFIRDISNSFNSVPESDMLITTMEYSMMLDYLK